MMFDGLELVHQMAKLAQVSWSLHYAESDDSWYCVVTSVAPSEDFIGRNRSLPQALTDVIDHLKGLAR